MFYVYTNKPFISIGIGRPFKCNVIQHKSHTCRISVFKRNNKKVGETTSKKRRRKQNAGINNNNSDGDGGAALDQSKKHYE